MFMKRRSCLFRTLKTTLQTKASSLAFASCRPICPSSPNAPLLVHHGHSHSPTRSFVRPPSLSRRVRIDAVQPVHLHDAVPSSPCASRRPMSSQSEVPGSCRSVVWLPVSRRASAACSCSASVQRPRRDRVCPALLFCHRWPDIGVQVGIGVAFQPSHCCALSRSSSFLSIAWISSCNSFAPSHVQSRRAKEACGCIKGLPS